MLAVAPVAPQRHERLTIFPLVSATRVELPYVLLADALGTGAVRITEVGSGTVPNLLAVNRGDAAVLVLDGEQLVGAKQNRMTNRSLLLPAKSETEIPVSCMERGRWHPGTPDMAPAPHHSPAGVRRHARSAEAAYAASGSGAPTEALALAQSDLWAEIDDYSRRVGARSRTAALNDLYDATGSRLDDWARRFRQVPGQVGLLAFLDDAPLGMDLIGGRALFARVHARLLRGYLMDALAAGAAPKPNAGAPIPARDPAPPTAEAAQAFLDRVRRADRVPAPTVGQGTYRVLAGPVIGAELEDDGRVVHLSAFPAHDRPKGESDAERAGGAAIGGPRDPRDPTGGPGGAEPGVSPGYTSFPPPDGSPLAPPSRRRRKRG